MDSDYLLILAGRYGSLGVDDNGKKVGYTEMEFDYALLKNKPIIVLVHNNIDSLPSRNVEKNKNSIARLERFREKAQTGRMVAFWENKDQLHSAVLSSLHTMMNSDTDAIGWIRANEKAIPKMAEEEENVIILNKFINRMNNNESIDGLTEYLESLKMCDIIGLFSNIQFVMKYCQLISVLGDSELIIYMIDIIPDYSRINYDIREILDNNINVFSLFDIDFRSNNFIKSNKLSKFISILTKLRLFSIEYSSIVFDILKKADIIGDKTKKACFHYFELHNYFNHEMSTKEQIKYYLSELDNDKRVLSIEDLYKLLVICCKTEDDFSILYDVFLHCDSEYQKTILYNMFSYCGSDLFLMNPKTQKEFMSICDIVYSWNDNKTTADMLLYCLFTRTYDIFTTDEIFSRLEKVNDDVFYLFIRQVSTEEFGFGCEEYYDVDSSEKDRIKEIIIERHHPRGHKLLELMN